MIIVLLIKCTAAAFMIAIIAEIYSNVLTQPGQALSRFYGFVDRKIPEIIGKPIILCEKCVCGQLMLWTFFIKNFNNYKTALVEKNIIHLLNILLIHAYCICASIFIIIILHKIILWTRKLS